MTITSQSKKTGIQADLKRESDSDWRRSRLQETLTNLYIYTEATNSDFDFWSKKPCWTIDEAAALCVGRNPKLFQFDVMAAYEDYDDCSHKYLNIKDTISRAISVGKLANPIIPIEFIQWAEPHCIKDIPDRLSKGVKEFNKLLCVPQGDDIRLNLRENLQLTIYLLAVKHLEYGVTCSP